MLTTKEMPLQNTTANRKLVCAVLQKDHATALEALCAGANPYAPTSLEEGSTPYPSLIVLLHSHKEHKNDPVSQSILRMLLYAVSQETVNTTSTPGFFSLHSFPEELFVGIENVKRCIQRALYKPYEIRITAIDYNIPMRTIYSIADYKVRLLYAYYNHTQMTGRHVEAKRLVGAIMKENEHWPYTKNDPLWNSKSITREYLLKQFVKDNALEQELAQEYLQKMKKNSTFYVLLEYMYGRDRFLFDATLKSYIQSENNEGLISRYLSEEIEEECTFSELKWNGNYFECTQEGVTYQVSESKAVTLLEKFEEEIEGFTLL